MSGPRGALRLVVSPPSRLHALDGAWWPRSRDLATECRDLLDQLPAEVGHVDRIVYSRPDWEPDPTSVPTGWPRRVQVARGCLKTGSFPEDDTHTVVLALSDRSRVTLLLVPVDTDRERAIMLMAAAVDPDDDRSAIELLGDHRLVDGEALHAWDSEGGATEHPHLPSRTRSGAT